MGLFKKDYIKEVEPIGTTTTTINTDGFVQILATESDVKIKLLAKDAKLPTRGSKAAAGYDVYAYLNGGWIDIPPHETKLIGTGLAMAIPNSYFLGIYPRSGLATKQGLRPANCVGIVDSDYRGEIKVALHNDTNETKTVKHGERIAQFILQKFDTMNFQIVEELEETDRGEGGFGSTGTK